MRIQGEMEGPEERLHADGTRGKKGTFEKILD